MKRTKKENKITKKFIRSLVAEGEIKEVSISGSLTILCFNLDSNVVLGRGLSRCLRGVDTYTHLKELMIIIDNDRLREEAIK